MYINQGIFKKMLKEAWEQNVLILSRKEDRLLIQGGGWVVETDLNLLPNKGRAAIVELAGELPEAGQTFRAGKGQENQYVFEQTVGWELIARAEKAHLEMEQAERTRIMLYSKQGKLYRVMRTAEKSILINEIAIQAIDPGMIMETESAPTGPYDAGHYLYWTNGIVWFLYLKNENEEDQSAQELLKYSIGMRLED